MKAGVLCNVWLLYEILQQFWDLGLNVRFLMSMNMEKMARGGDKTSTSAVSFLKLRSQTSSAALTSKPQLLNLNIEELQWRDVGWMVAAWCGHELLDIKERRLIPRWRCVSQVTNKSQTTRVDRSIWARVLNERTISQPVWTRRPVTEGSPEPTWAFSPAETFSRGGRTKTPVDCTATTTTVCVTHRVYFDGN